MADCQNQKTEKSKCSCPSTNCERHAACCACVRYHRERGDLPMCLRK